MSITGSETSLVNFSADFKTPKGVLLVNLGTPDNPQPAAVRRYLSEFLRDPRVIDIPILFRYLLLYLFILPFRPKKSSDAYRSIWTKEGSPLLTHSLDLCTIPKLCRLVLPRRVVFKGIRNCR